MRLHKGDKVVPLGTKSTGVPIEESLIYKAFVSKKLPYLYVVGISGSIVKVNTEPGCIGGDEFLEKDLRKVIDLDSKPAPIPEDKPTYKFKVGDKVVPVSKSVAGLSLMDSNEWRRARAIKQPFLYVNMLPGGGADYYIAGQVLTNDAGEMGDYFMETDLVPYDESAHIEAISIPDATYKSRFKIGDKVMLNPLVAKYSYGMGGVSHDEVGEIVDITSDRLVIDFPTCKMWWGVDYDVIPAKTTIPEPIVGKPWVPKYKVGDKVVPHKKSIAGDLSKSCVWNRAKEKGQPFLYVTILPAKSDDCYTLNDTDTPTGDFFMEDDLTLYVEDTEYKPESTYKFKVGDRVVPHMKHGKVAELDKSAMWHRAKREGRGYLTIRHLPGEVAIYGSYYILDGDYFSEGDFTLYVEVTESKPAMPEIKHERKIAMTLSEHLVANGFSKELIKNVVEFRKQYVSENDSPRIPSPSVWYIGEALRDATEAILAGYHVILEGGKGVGKNTLVDTLGYMFKRPMYQYPFNGNVDVSSIVGTDVLGVDDNGHSVVTFRPHHLVQAMQDTDTAWFVGDEINMTRADVLAILHMVTDYRGYLDLPGYGVVKSSPGFRFIGTMNYGYMGTQELNEAFGDRFCIIKVDPMKPDKFTQALIDGANVLRDVATRLVKLYTDLEAKAQTGVITTRSVSVRGIYQAIGLVKQGMDTRKALDIAITNKSFDSFERQQVKDVLNTLFRPGETWFDTKKVLASAPATPKHTLTMSAPTTVAPADATTIAGIDITGIPMKGGK